MTNYWFSNAPMKLLAKMTKWEHLNGIEDSTVSLGTCNESNLQWDSLIYLHFMNWLSFLKCANELFSLSIFQIKGV